MPCLATHGDARESGRRGRPFLAAMSRRRRQPLLALCRAGGVFVAGAAEPCLVVNDLKLGESRGGIGLFVGPGSLGYFRNLRVRAADGARP